MITFLKIYNAMHSKQRTFEIPLQSYYVFCPLRNKIWHFITGYILKKVVKTYKLYTYPVD